MATVERDVLGMRVAAHAGNKRESAVSRLLRLLCSARLGVLLLCLMVATCMIGMLVMQQNVDGFESYYATLTRAERLVYWKLGFFNIYHSWYFNALLCLISLNIVLASVDRFPKTWTYVSRPQVTVPPRWLQDREQSASFVVHEPLGTFITRSEKSLKDFGWRSVRIAKKDGRTFVFGESGVWNRLGAYAVHVSLLTILLGGFFTSWFSTGGSLSLSPGESSNLIHNNVVDLDNVHQITMRLPFEITVTDIEQKLVRRDGPIAAANTLDWITRFAIRDATGKHDAVVQMNQPFDYRGYRFFQASFTRVGRARSITLELTPVYGPAKHVKIPRDGKIDLADGTRIRFADFRGNFRYGPDDPEEDTSMYPNPAAVLEVMPQGEAPQTAYAFGSQFAGIPIASKPVAGYTFKLTDFERVADKHVLSIQRDPGANIVYVGFALLSLTLVGVLFFSHQRIWVAIEESPKDILKVVTAGHTNRNPNSFDEKFQRFLPKLRSKAK